MELVKQPTYHLSAALKSVADPFLATIGCHYFQYLKVFSNGSFSFLTTQPKWNDFTDNLLSNTNMPAVYSHIDGHTLDKNKFTFLWDPNLPKTPVGFAREFNITSGFTFVERYQDYYFMFGFGAPETNHRAIDNYFNSLNDMHDFLQRFKIEQHKLITDIDKNRYNVSKERQDCNLQQMLLGSNKAPNHLTTQELACIKGLAKGMSYKDIAKSLNISHRTVETYLNRVRLRLNLQRKRDLIALL